VRRVGKCNRCGKCCTGRGIFSTEIGKGTLRKFLKAHGVAGKAAKAFAEMAPTITCSHLAYVRDEKGDLVAQCLIYEDRPWFCRAYPAVEEDLIEGCGFTLIEDIGDDRNMELGDRSHGSVHGTPSSASRPENAQG
jgi:Fe-S-cluster containining protein